LQQIVCLSLQRGHYSYHAEQTMCRFVRFHHRTTTAASLLRGSRRDFLRLGRLWREQLVVARKPFEALVDPGTSRSGGEQGGPW
jgi:hypothetical protein